MSVLAATIFLTLVFPAPAVNDSFLHSHRFAGDSPFIQGIQSTGNILYVGGSGQNNYTSIQEAINNASDGDTVFVYSGTYEEIIRVWKSIYLMGEHKNTTIIDGDFNGTVVEIDADGTVMKHFTITGGSGGMDDAGILITSGYVTVQNNTILDNEGTGIYLLSASHCRISHNVLMGNRYGGISLTEESHANNISRNDIRSGISGIYVSESNEQNISYNRVTNCSKGIYLTESSGATIIGNHLTGNEEGLFSYYASGNTIKCNNFISNVRNARFATFFHTGFLAPNRWVQNYWDDWIRIGAKVIFGVVYVPTFSLIGLFIPWVNFDWHPAQEPYEWRSS